MVNKNKEEQKTRRCLRNVVLEVNATYSMYGKMHEHLHPQRGSSFKNSQKHVEK